MQVPACKACNSTSWFQMLASTFMFICWIYVSLWQHMCQHKRKQENPGFVCRSLQIWSCRYKEFVDEEFNGYCSLLKLPAMQQSHAYIYGYHHFCVPSGCLYLDRSHMHTHSICYLQEGPSRLPGPKGMKVGITVVCAWQCCSDNWIGYWILAKYGYQLVAVLHNVYW